MKNILSYFDSFISWYFQLEGGVDEREFAEARREVREVDHILYDMDVIDTKSSALLTHVSIMLAVVALMLTSLGPAVPVTWRVLLVLELVAFSLVAMMLLRCVDVMGPPLRRLPPAEHLLDSTYRVEILIRRAIYQSMVRIVFGLTLVLIAIVVVKYGCS